MSNNDSLYAPASSPVTTLDAEQPTSLILTGRRCNRRFKVFVNGQPVMLPSELLRTLIELVVASGNHGSGLQPEEPNTIFRLRKAIDKAIGPGGGAALIKTGASREYHLAIPRKQVAAHVGLTSCFLELVGLQMLTQEQYEQLQRTCRMCGAEECDRLLGDD